MHYTILNLLLLEKRTLQSEGEEEEGEGSKGQGWRWRGSPFGCSLWSAEKVLKSHHVDKI
jgi:hypothetical protein